ncbi:hypothetical protein LBMAG15_02400 [Actinomycetes bacterium]|nr:hypothetical protein LBMAG15_02400 [Actinomycetes bacterium]
MPPLAAASPGRRGRQLFQVDGHPAPAAFRVARADLVAAPVAPVGSPHAAPVAPAVPVAPVGLRGDQGHRGAA